jgi:hypothetical protein
VDEVVGAVVTPVVDVAVGDVAGLLVQPASMARIIAAAHAMHAILRPMNFLPPYTSFLLHPAYMAAPAVSADEI